MIAIQPVPPGQEYASRQHSARLILQAYKRFLQSLEAHAGFDFARFELEIATVPSTYTACKGEVLLASVGGVAAGCIAYRESSDGTALRSCEIKRLFVLPEWRGYGIARHLVSTVLERAANRGFTRAMLDTDKAAMAAAYSTYVKAGFREYARKALPEDGPLVFLERRLPE